MQRNAEQRSARYKGKSARIKNTGIMHTAYAWVRLNSTLRQPGGRVQSILGWYHTTMALYTEAPTEWERVSSVYTQIGNNAILSSPLV